MNISIFALHKTGGIYTKYTDADALIAFFTRTGRASSYQILVTKGTKALNIEKVDNFYELKKEINNFMTQG